MFLHSLALNNFKNYTSVRISFEKKINCLVGPNGAGKTNILDAIYYCCLTKSYFNAIDSQNINHEEKFSRIEAEFGLSDQQHQLKCILQRRKKKGLTWDDVPYDRLSDHIGKLPVVMISPDDVILIQGGSEERRKFLDALASQLDRQYLEQLQRYQHVLNQRNAFLKSVDDYNKIDYTLIEVYDVKLQEYGSYIHKYRNQLVAQLEPLFLEIYNSISGDKEAVKLEYESQLSDRDIKEQFKSAFQKDLILRRTTVGIHRDNLDFKMDGESVKRFGSQGQQKSFLVSLKLAQVRLMRQQKNTDPFILLDDIFDKLDMDRGRNLLQLVLQEGEGQIFITDTNRERIEQAFTDSLDQVAIFNVDQGAIG